MLQNKLLIISGPTATGKTAIAVALAKKYGGELISADSRQIYKGMDIGIGKDHPKDTPIHLIDVLTPNQSFSVAEYQRLAVAKIKELWSQNKLPIIVGGSGQYIDAIIHPQSTFKIKQNKLLRLILNRLTLKQLQFTLRLLDFQSFNALNNSDLNNPRRLIRKIEIKLSSVISLFCQRETSRSDRGILSLGVNFVPLHLSLTAPLTSIYQKIDARVDQRLKDGHLEEIKTLLKTYSWSTPGLQVSAYHEMQPYFQNHLSLENCLQKWKFREHRDARHQKTWFKKSVPDYFIDITKAKYKAKIEEIVDKWYNMA